MLHLGGEHGSGGSIGGFAQATFDGINGTAVDGAGGAQRYSGRKLDVEGLAVIDLHRSLGKGQAHDMTAGATLIIDEVEVIARYFESGGRVWKPKPYKRADGRLEIEGGLVLDHFGERRIRGVLSTHAAKSRNDPCTRRARMGDPGGAASSI